MTAALNISETGRRAYLAGLKASANPFRIGSQARSLWAKGFRHARALERRDDQIMHEGTLQDIAEYEGEV